MLVVNGTRLLLRSPHDMYITVVTEEDIKLPLGLRCRVGETMKKRVLQLVAVEEDTHED